MGQSSVIEAALRRDRLVVAAGLVIVAGAAWGWTLAGVGMPMDHGGSMAMHETIGSVATTTAAWSPSHAALIFLMWWIMMTAMMVPSAAPLVLLAAALHRRKGRDGRPDLMASLLTAGYLAVWGAFSLVATLAQWGLGLAGLISPGTMAAGPAARWRHSAGRRPLPAHPAQASLPEALPLAGGVRHRALAARTGRRVQDGACARRLLRRLLLVPDGAAVRWRRDEPVLDRRDRALRARGEARPPRPPAEPCERVVAGGHGHRHAGSGHSDDGSLAQRARTGVRIRGTRMVDWYVEGVAFGNCNCDYGCPCQFERRPTHGNCRGFEVAADRQGPLRRRAAGRPPRRPALRLAGRRLRGRRHDAGDHRRACRRAPAPSPGHDPPRRGDGGGQDPLVGLPRHVEHGARADSSGRSSSRSTSRSGGRRLSSRACWRRPGGRSSARPPARSTGCGSTSRTASSSSWPRSAAPRPGPPARSSWT